MKTGPRYTDLLARYRKQFAEKELVEQPGAPDGSLRAFRLQMRDRKWGRMESTYLLFTPEGIIIAGDLCPENNKVCASDLGYGLGWFTSPRSDDYLCSKFFRPCWVPELGEHELKRALLQQRREGNIDKAKARDLFDEIRWADPLSGPEAFRIYSDAGLYDFENLGYGYEPRDAALLVVIQERFAACYLELHAEELMRKSA